jgi:hypothetical protein
VKAWLKRNDFVVGFYGISGFATIVLAVLHP